MNTPPLNHLICTDIDTFWADKLRPVTNQGDVKLFVHEYLPLLGVDYDRSIAKAISQLQLINTAEVQPLVSEFITLANLICNEHDADTHLELWRQLAKIAGYDKGIDKIDVNLSSRSNTVKYIKVLLSDNYLKLWPMHDIAYKIVNVMAHYDIAKSDRPLYEIWDLATEIETMILAEIEKSGKCDEMIRLSKNLG